MFRHLFISKRLIALLLPLVLFMSWAACLSWCEEITAQQSNFNQGCLTEPDGNCPRLTGLTESCTMTANAVVPQERQTVKMTVLAAALSSALAFRAPSPAWAALLPEIKQNSPPRSIFVPLFLRFCVFRI